MNRRSPFAAVLALFVAASAPAQTFTTLVAPRVNGSAPAVVPFSPALGGASFGASLLGPSALAPTLLAPSFVPTPTAFLGAATTPAAFKPTALAAKPALAGVRNLSAALEAASKSKDESAKPAALNAAFDGLLAASKSDDSTPVAPKLTPEQFALRAQQLLAEAKRAAAERLASEGVATEDAIVDDGQITDRLNRLPSTNPERMRYMVELFKLGGATDADIKLQDAGRGRNNVIVTKKGKTDRVIVVGGHYDQVSEGLGKIDNGTGSTMVANLYQALHDVETDATIVFIAFAREEEGLYGSEAYVRSLNKAQKDKIDAMINLDTLAVDGTYALSTMDGRRHSTPALVERAVAASRESGHSLAVTDLNGGDADATSFRQAGIPAITLYGASADVIFDIIHSERDNMSAFNVAHYRNAFLLTHEFIKSLDRQALGPVEKRKI